MSKPVLSFVLPVYKKPADVFRNCLKAIFDSSLKEIEVICVFDGEDKELQLVCADFKVITLVIEHGGACKARNAGLELATGNYVVFWDSDCYIKPHTARRWIEEFDAVPDADFVYTGYELSNERGGLESESFDAYSLTCGNYISSMSPIKRGKAHTWDESLPAAQDWDYWLTAVERGLKGAFIPGPGFTVGSLDSGISSEHWSAGKREETINRVRLKHGIVNRDIGVYSMNYRERAIPIARILGGDFVKQTGISPDKYKVLINIGYGFLSRFEGIPKETVKIQYWLPGEIPGLSEAKYSVVTETIRIAKGVINWCGTEYEKNKLSELGITADVVVLPIDEENTAKAATTLPEEFSVLVLADESYTDLLKDLPTDLPHVKFGVNAGKAVDYSCLLHFYRFSTVDDSVLIAHLNGRNVISNIQAPYCGYIDPDQSWDAFKKELYEKIRETAILGFNQKAKDHCLSIVDPKPFKERVYSLLPVALEVVA
jgi:glycosyltransferase involved in cell wall biosynthesis